MRKFITLLVLLLPASVPARADEHSPPKFLFDVKAGDSYEKVSSLQGWYPCDGALKGLCYDQVTTLGETGRFSINFINGRAFSADLTVSGTDAFYRMIDRLPEWNGGIQTLASIRTTNAEIDVIRAVNELGKDKAYDQFSRYVRPEGRGRLESIEMVPHPPPPLGRYLDAKAYLDDLPRGAMILHLSFYRYPLNVTNLTMSLPLAEKAALFPEYCVDNCKDWRVPSPPEKETGIWEKFLGLFR